MRRARRISPIYTSIDRQGVDIEPRQFHSGGCANTMSIGDGRCTGSRFIVLRFVRIVPCPRNLRLVPQPMYDPMAIPIDQTGKALHATVRHPRLCRHFRASRLAMLIGWALRLIHRASPTVSQSFFEECSRAIEDILTTPGKESRRAFSELLTIEALT
jgi:hypothetical protein